MAAREQFAHLVGQFAHADAQSLTHGEVEALIHTEGTELLRRLTHGRRQVLIEEVIESSFDETLAQLGRTGGGRMAKRQVEEVAVRLSRDFDAYLYARLCPVAEASRSSIPSKSPPAEGPGRHANARGPASQPIGVR